MAEGASFGDALADLAELAFVHVPIIKRREGAGKVGSVRVVLGNVSAASSRSLNASG